MELQNVEASDMKQLSRLLYISADLERIADHAENIANYTITVSESKLNFSQTAIEELQDLGRVTAELMSMAYTAYEKQDKSKLPQIKELENHVDSLSALYAKNHFKRLKRKLCKPKSGVVYMDIVNDLEKSADNAEKIMISM